jgi:hypothetical protein
MREIVAIIGTCLVGSSVATYFVSFKAGICAALFLAGAGLLIDAVKK